MTEARLTAREREVCEGIADGKTVRSIASDMGISERTVTNYITSVARLIPGEAPPMRRIMRWWLTKDGSQVDLTG